MDGAKDVSSNISGKLQIESNQKALKLISGIRLKTLKQPLLNKQKKKVLEVLRLLQSLK